MILERFEGRQFARQGLPIRYEPVHQIIQELPKLPEADRWAIRKVPLEMASQDVNVALCSQAALEAAMMSKGMEDEDARRKFR